MTPTIPLHHLESLQWAEPVSAGVSARAEFDRCNRFFQSCPPTPAAARPSPFGCLGLCSSGRRHALSRSPERPPSAKARNGARGVAAIVPWPRARVGYLPRQRRWREGLPSPFRVGVSGASAVRPSSRPAGLCVRAGDVPAMRSPTLAARSWCTPGALELRG